MEVDPETPSPGEMMPGDSFDAYLVSDLASARVFSYRSRKFSLKRRRVRL